MRALMRRPAVTQDGEAGLLHGLCGVQLLLQAAFVQRAHPVSCGLIFDLPQAHDDGVHARDLECATQAEDAFSHLDHTQTRVAGREHGPFDPVEIEARDFLRCQDAILVFGAGAGAAVGAGKREPGEQERVVRRTGDSISEASR